MDPTMKFVMDLVLMGAFLVLMVWTLWVIRPRSRRHKDGVSKVTLWRFIRKHGLIEGRRS